MLNLTNNTNAETLSHQTWTSTEQREVAVVPEAALDEPDRLLNVRQLQAALCMSRAKVYRMMQDGTLPTVRVGGSVRVPRRALFQWIEDNTRPARRLAV